MKFSSLGLLNCQMPLWCLCVLSHSVVSTSLQPHGQRSPAGSRQKCWSGLPFPSPGFDAPEFPKYEVDFSLFPTKGIGHRQGFSLTLICFSLPKECVSLVKNSIVEKYYLVPTPSTLHYFTPNFKMFIFLAFLLICLSLVYRLCIC